jgi:hypothetical protein
VSLVLIGIPSIVAVLFVVLINRWFELPRGVAVAVYVLTTLLGAVAVLASWVMWNKRASVSKEPGDEACPNHAPYRPCPAMVPRPERPNPPARAGGPGQETHPTQGFPVCRAGSGVCHGTALTGSKSLVGVMLIPRASPGTDGTGPSGRAKHLKDSA